jgi:hypothetical protein
MTVHVIYVVPIILGLCTLVATTLLAALGLKKRLEHKEAVIAWMEERDDTYLIPMAQMVQASSAIKLPHISTFRQFFRDGIITKEGVQHAGQLLEQHEALIMANREFSRELASAVKKYKELAEWEAANPVPELEEKT